MGFRAKVLILSERTAVAEEKGPSQETNCVIWEDSGLEINFGHVTRLEKLISSRFARTSSTPFRRAGIFMTDCFLGRIYDGMDLDVRKWLAPEILIHNSFYTQDLTIKVGGAVYMDCLGHRLDVTEELGQEVISRHNEVVKMDACSIAEHFEEWIHIEPPLLWASCRDMASWICAAEVFQSEGWKVIAEDRLSLAFVRGWRQMLDELGETGARAVFRFS